MIEYYQSVLKQYTNFSGRARRKEYWYFTLVNLIIVYGLQIVGFLLVKAGMSAVGGIIAILVSLYTLATLLPTFAVAVRRMHDVGKSGWFLLIPIYNLVLAVTEGEKGANQYGPDPKASERGLLNAEQF